MSKAKPLAVSYLRARSFSRDFITIQSSSTIAGNIGEIHSELLESDDS